jgi:hypothetical protein
LLKAYLCSLHPALVVEAAHWPSLLHAVGHGARAGIPESRTKSIGLKLAFERVRTLLKPKMAVTDAVFELVFAARNGVAHVGAHDAEATRAVIGTCIRITAPVLAEMKIDSQHYWGDYISLVEQLAEEQINELRLTYEAKLARAKRTFGQRFGSLPFHRREEVVAAVAATELTFSDYGLQTGCPACESEAWLDGSNEIIRDVDADVDTEDHGPNLVFYPSSFRCVVCGLELDGEELKLASLDQEQYRDVEDPSAYIPVDEDFAYESWRDDQITGP